MPIEDDLSATAVELRREIKRLRAADPFAKWHHKDDPEGILPEIIAARCLGIEVGDPGPKRPKDACARCYEDHQIWCWNTWGLKRRDHPLEGCDCTCHEIALGGIGAL